MIIKEDKHFYFKIQLSTLYLIFISLAFLITLYFYNSIKSQEYNPITLYKLFSYVEENYKGDISKEDIYKNAMKGVINYLDPYSFSVIKKNESSLETVTQNEEINLEDSFIGLGIATKYNENGILITDIFKQSDFYNKANIGDVITSINKNKYNGRYEEFREHLQGNRGDFKNIEILSAKDNEYKEITVSIKEIYKDIIEINLLKNNILHIEIKEFTENLNYKLMNKLEQFLHEKGGFIDFNGIILNLAENRGGVFIEGLTLAANFVGNSNEVALYSEYNDQKSSTEYFLSGQNIFEDIPMALIVNKNSASSSEIFAGIFKNFNRGTIIGQNTFGKGVGQRLVKFNDEFEFAITTFEFYIGKDRTKINKVGVIPNILIEEDYLSNKDKYIKEAMKVLSDNKKI